jgi:hypothetical protein
VACNVCGRPEYEVPIPRTAFTPAQLDDLGKAVQLDPIKPELKAPGANFFTLTNDDLLSSFAFNFKLRRYTWGTVIWTR